MLDSVTMKLLLLLTACALPLLSQSSYPPDMPESRSVVYKSIDGTDLRLYIFEPEGHRMSDRTPAVVFFFGGGWNGGSPTQFREHSKYLASRGMVAIAADYRVKSRHGVDIYQCVEDAKAAMRWVRSHAAELGIDPGRIAAAGGSAGGHLAAATAMLPGHDDIGGDQSVSPVPDALALFNPATVMAPAERHGLRADGASAIMRERSGAPLESISPYHHVKADPPPTIIFHGQADTTVPFVTAEMFCEKLKEIGGRCELEGYEGKTHGFFNFGRDREAYADTVRKMDQFFVSLGWLTGEPAI